MNQRDCIELVNRTIEKAAKTFSIAVKLSVDVKFDIKTHRLSGQAARKSATEYTIRLNPETLKHNPETYANTVIHEVAHVITWVLYPTATPHGKHWKYVMHQLGAQAKRCSSYNMPAQNKKVFSYTCKCGVNHQLSPLIHRRIQEGQYRVCSRCKSRISLVQN